MTLKKHSKLILAGLIGNVLEWYDFSVYGYFAVVFASKFFPSDDPAISLIQSFGAFAAGFLMRPVGAAFFGHIGDHHGRKKALSLSIFFMAFPTLLIGILPGYDTIGILAPILLVLLRMLQGLSVGGEYTSSIVYLSESAPKGKRGLFSSAALIGGFAGILLGSLVGSFIMGFLSVEQVHAWGWRLPFLMGVPLAFFGFYIRRKMPETMIADKNAKKPLAHVHRNWKGIMMVSGLNVLSAVSFYAVFIFMSTWLQNYVHISHSLALQINSFCMVVLMIVAPVAAWISDKVGRKPVLIAASLALMLFAYPLIWLMHHQNTLMILTGQTCLSIIIGSYMGIIPSVLSEMFPKKTRVSSVGLGYNIIYAILGGTAPVLAMWVIHKTNNEISFAWLIILAASISFITALFIKEYSQNDLHE